MSSSQYLTASTKSATVKWPLREKNVNDLGAQSSKKRLEQDCALLSRLPAEIRNSIYEAVFMSNSQPSSSAKTASERNKSESPSSPSHPLSLLQTCHQINEEATLIAFRLHSFVISQPLSFDALRKRIICLSSSQVSAIASVTFLQNDKNVALPHYDLSPANLIVHAIRLFPNVCDVWFELLTNRPATPNISLGNSGITDCSKHVPDWFNYSLSDFVRGEGLGYRWQNGEKWHVEWPYFHVHESTRESEVSELPESLCDGDCSARLTQENSGRQVTVRFHRDSDRTPRVQLDPECIQRLPVKMVCTSKGFEGLMYDPRKRYWKRVREWDVRTNSGLVLKQMLRKLNLGRVS